MVSKSGDVVRDSYSGLFSNKRGQVTVFIIIGIVILFAFAGIMYFTQTFTKESILASADPVISDLPQTFQPVATYTEGCLNQIGKKGLLILGEQGGYIYPDLVGEFSAAHPTDSDGLNLEPLKVPYWHYNVNPNENPEIQYTSLQPKLYYNDDKEMSIEAQLSRYVEENLKSCLADYTAFSSQGINVEFASDVVDVKATVGDETVNFLLNMPLKLAKGDAEQDVEEFYVKIPIRLKHYYEVASEIKDAESQYYFLEQQGIGLIATFSGLEPDLLPPTSEITFDVVPPVYWNEIAVKQKFKEVLIGYVPMLRYLGNDNFYRYEYEHNAEEIVDLSALYQKNYDNMILPLEIGDRVDVNFDYFGWELYFDLNDKGGKIEPRSYSTSFSRFSISTQEYSTSYDASYPVLITIEDEEALLGEGYKFVFAMESNFRNNDLVISGEVLPGPIASVGDSMACEDDKMNTEIIKSIVVDSYTKEPLQAVQIGFSIPNQDDCVLGETDLSGEFASSYPAVYGGVGSYVKEDYLTNFYPIDTYEFKDQPGIIGYATAGLNQNVVEMYKFRTIPVKVMKKSLEKCINGKCYYSALFSNDEEPITSYSPELISAVHSWVFSDATKSLSDTEKAVVLFNRVSGTNPGVISDEFTSAAEVRGTDFAEIELVPGVYEVSILLTNENELVIPKEERCSSGFVETFTCGVDGCCFTFEEMKMEKFMSGQVQWDSPKTYLTITPEQLYGSNELVLYVLETNLLGVPEEPKKRITEDMAVLGGLGNYSRILRGNLEPSYN